MSRTTWNKAVDACAYIGLVMLAATGMVLRYQLPPGSGRLDHIGLGSGAKSRPVHFVWGLDRQEWGSIHYWIALFLMGVLAVHLILHWKWIVSVIGRKAQPDVSGARFMLGIAGLTLTLLLAAAPLITPAESIPRAEAINLQNKQSDQETEVVEDGEEFNELRTIQGFMTLEEVASRSGVSVSDIVERLDLPRDTSPSSKVGRLLRAHGMDISDLRQAVGQVEPSR